MLKLVMECQRSNLLLQAHKIKLMNNIPFNVTQARIHHKLSWNSVAIEKFISLINNHVFVKCMKIWHSDNFDISLKFQQP